MRLQDYAPRPAHLKWLLDSDPAIRWQVMRDLSGESQGDCSRAVSRRQRRLGRPATGPPGSFRLVRSLRTGEVIDKRWLRFSYPSFWHYDVLRGLDYLRKAGIKPDSRVRGAITIVMERRHQNGRWPLNHVHPEFIPLQMETEVGRASRWNTLRALRVLRWYSNTHD